MNETNTAEASIDNNKVEATLPFSSGKQPNLKIAGIIGLIISVAIVNYFLFHKSNQHGNEKKDIDTYDISGMSPISKTTPNLNKSEPKTEVASDVSIKPNMEQELAAAKAKDFIERLQAGQNGNGAGDNYALRHQTSINMATNGSEFSAQANTAINRPNIDDPNTAFLVQESNSKAAHVYATHYGSLPYMIGQGKFIFATLAVAINSDLPGQITATVSQDIYGDQGRKVLIPRGSLLIGEYRSGLANNQSRLFVVWTRVREPNGIDVMLGSEGTDALGRAGLTGGVDYHFFARFGTATLIAMIGAGASTVGVNPTDEYNSSAAYRQSISQALSQQANNTLNQSINIPPTINIHQGEKIVVFVNRDLDFSRVIR